MAMSIGKKNFLLIASILFTFSLILMANAINTDDAWHPLQQIATDGTGTADIDGDDDGYVDYANDLQNCANCIDENEIDESNLMDLNEVLNVGNDAGAQDITNVANLDVTGFNCVDCVDETDIDESNLMDLNEVLNVGNDAGSQDIDNVGSITADTFYYSSDKRLKKDIAQINDATEKIQSISGVTFLWKENNEAEIGLIAQDVEKTFPELVKTNEEGMKSVKYGNMVAVLVEAVKEQQKEIDSLKEEIKQLKDEK